jgi:hypothetical protein
MAEDWKEANLKRIRDYDAVQKAKKTVAEYDPKEPNKPQWKKDNEARIKAYDAKQAKAKAAEYKMPKSTTPDMDTSKGSYGSASGESGPSMGRVIKAEKAEAAPVEERSTEVEAEEKRAPKEESRFSSSNPLGMKKGGSVSSASRRADGCAIRGKTRA